MSSGRVWTIVAGAAAAGGGYYMYKAGGNPKVAEKQMEYDASRVSSSLRSGMSGQGKEAEKGISLTAEQAGQKMDGALKDAKAKAAELDAQAQAYAAQTEKKVQEFSRDAGKNMNQAVDKFDKNVEETAAKSKSWFGGLFGGK
ncbi:hypothetical protein LTS18_003223 [Coniosporium uncinatum]|uniref:Uncharacterized protein n=1 Tax=Coniosporium uncinatum TaxID=93489 RepID=A0ACC3D757_9PEZI|nr:hypothetical protein LTS18_003223 [Coniosporium uncinatum]